MCGPTDFYGYLTNIDRVRFRMDLKLLLLNWFIDPF
jgi:hypothetical protein